MRQEAEAIYNQVDYSLEDAFRALNLISEASAIERALNLPPQTKTTASLYVFTPHHHNQEEYEAALQRGREYNEQKDMKDEERKAIREERRGEAPRPDLKQLPAQLSFF